MCILIENCVITLDLIFSNEASVDKYRKYYVIDVRTYSIVNKLGIPFEEWLTLRSNISVILELAYCVDIFLTDEIRRPLFSQTSVTFFVPWCFDNLNDILLILD